jgi:hypothetical protein
MRDSVKVAIMALVLIALLAGATTFLVKTSVKLDTHSVMKQAILI